MIYDKPIIYTLSHVMIGFVGYFYIELLVLFLIYQFSQLIMNKRFFLFEFKLKEGNSLQHTLYKLGETVVGFVLAAFIHIFSSVIRFLP
jgi:hypothetical protein